jgi:hypothetical protein
MKRLGIFFFYEKNGDVDDFITYYLADLHKNLTELVVVCNGKLSAQGRAAFEQFTDTIIVRENKGLDVWAYKTALDFYGWEKLSEYDEIVMTNSTLMGPVRPLQEMLSSSNSPHGSTASEPSLFQFSRTNTTSMASRSSAPPPSEDAPCSPEEVEDPEPLLCVPACAEAAEPLCVAPPILPQLIIPALRVLMSVIWTHEPVALTICPLPM